MDHRPKWEVKKTKLLLIKRHYHESGWGRKNILQYIHLTTNSSEYVKSSISQSIRKN